MLKKEQENMSKKLKKLCKWDKEAVLEDPLAFLKLVKKPKYICEKCIRPAKNLEVLCKPVPLPEKIPKT